MKPDRFIWIYDDEPRGLALLRGFKVTHVLETANMTERAYWSKAGQGWVVTTKDLADLLAVCDWLRVPTRLKTVGGDTAAEVIQIPTPWEAS